MNKRSFVVPILISIFALVAVPVSVSAVTQKSSEINVCVDWTTKEIKYSKLWEKCPAKHTAMTLGSEGSSAYEIAVANGFVGTVDEWLTSLEGKDGADGARGRAGSDGSGGSGAGPQGETGLQGIQGIQGDQGDQGDQGVKGVKGDQGVQGVKGDQGDAGPTIRSDRDFGISTAAGGASSVDGADKLVATWNLPADSSGVWSYTVVLRTHDYGKANDGRCFILVKDSDGFSIGVSQGLAYWYANSSSSGSMGFGTGYAVVYDAQGAARENRDINVEPYFELWCSASVAFYVDAEITMVEASDFNSSIW